MSAVLFAQPTPRDLTPFATGLRICGAVSVDTDENVRISEWSSERVGIYDKGGHPLAPLKTNQSVAIIRLNLPNNHNIL